MKGLRFGFRIHGWDSGFKFEVVRFWLWGLRVEGLGLRVVYGHTGVISEL